MSSLKNKLIKMEIIKDVFDYQGLDDNLVYYYTYFEKKFQELLKQINLKILNILSFVVWKRNLNNIAALRE